MRTGHRTHPPLRSHTLAPAGPPRTHTHTHTHTRTHTYTHMHPHTHTRIHTCTHIHTHAPTHLRRRTCVCARKHMHTQPHTHRHTHTGTLAHSQGLAVLCLNHRLPRAGQGWHATLVDDANKCLRHEAVRKSMCSSTLGPPRRPISSDKMAAPEQHLQAERALSHAAPVPTSCIHLQSPTGGQGPATP